MFSGLTHRTLSLRRGTVSSALVIVARNSGGGKIATKARTQSHLNVGTRGSVVFRILATCGTISYEPCGSASADTVIHVDD